MMVIFPNISPKLSNLSLPQNLKYSPQTKPWFGMFPFWGPVLWVFHWLWPHSRTVRTMVKPHCWWLTPLLVSLNHSKSVLFFATPNFGDETSHYTPMKNAWCTHFSHIWLPKSQLHLFAPSLESIALLPQGLQHWHGPPWEPYEKIGSY